MNQQADKKNLAFVSLYKLSAMFFILLCHLFQTDLAGDLLILSSFFVLGVNMFFVASAFCLGLQGSIHNIPQWYFKRAKKIYFPYEIFVAVLFLITLKKGMEINKLHWLLLIFGLQGAETHIIGSEQTWFVSALLFCYFLTPLFSFICDHLKSKKCNIILIFSLPILYFILSLILPRNIIVIFLVSVFYFIAYICGRNYCYLKKDMKLFILCIISGLCALAVRLVLGLTNFNSSISFSLINILHYYIVFALLYCFYYVFCNYTCHKITDCLLSVSYEVYLYQMMVIMGPLYVHFTDEPFWLRILIYTAIIFLISIAAHILYILLNKLIIKRKERN